MRPAQLLRRLARRLRPHPHREVRVPQTGPILLDHEVHGEVVELQRHPAPPHAVELAWPARRDRLADGADAPRTVARRGVAVGRDLHRLAREPQLATPGADAREARRVEQDRVALAADVLRLRDRSVVGLPQQVEADAVLVGVADQPQLLERLDHLDAVRPDLLASCGRRAVRPTCGPPTACRRAARSRTRRSRRGSGTRRAR